MNIYDIDTSKYRPHDALIHSNLHLSTMDLSSPFSNIGVCLEECGRVENCHGMECLKYVHTYIHAYTAHVPLCHESKREALCMNNIWPSKERCNATTLKNAIETFPLNNSIYLTRLPSHRRPKTSCGSNCISSGKLLLFVQVASRNIKQPLQLLDKHPLLITNIIPVKFL